MLDQSLSVLLVDLDESGKLNETTCPQVWPGVVVRLTWSGRHNDVRHRTHFSTATIGIA